MWWLSRVSSLLSYIACVTVPASSATSKMTYCLCVQVVADLQADFADFNAVVGSLSPDSQIVFQNTVMGIHQGLEDLEMQLSRHLGPDEAETNTANPRFSESVGESRDRLRMHMGSLTLLLNTIQLAKGTRIEDAVQAIREAQLEQNNNTIESQISSFRMIYAPKSTASEGESKVSQSARDTNREGLIRAWGKRVEQAASEASTSTYLNTYDGASTGMRSCALSEIV